MQYFGSSSSLSDNIQPQGIRDHGPCCACCVANTEACAHLIAHRVRQEVSMEAGMSSAQPRPRCFGFELPHQLFDTVLISERFLGEQADRVHRTTLLRENWATCLSTDVPAGTCDTGSCRPLSPGLAATTEPRLVRRGRRCALCCRPPPLSPWSSSSKSNLVDRARPSQTCVTSVLRQTTEQICIFPAAECSTCGPVRASCQHCCCHCQCRCLSAASSRAYSVRHL